MTRRALLLLIAIAAAASGEAVAHPTVTLAAPSALLNITPVHQKYGLDCEAAALQMALQGVGISTSQDALIALMGADTRLPVLSGGNPVRWGDPYVSFVGNVRGNWMTTGYGAYYPPITAAAQASGAAAFGQTGWQPAQLYAAVASGYPVVVLVPHLMEAESIGHWTAWDGRSVWYSRQDHAQVLMGVDPSAATVTLADPLDGLIHTYARPLFESRFAGFGSQAVVVRPPDGVAPIVTSTGQQAVFWKGGDNGLWEAWTSGGHWTPAVEVSATPMASAPAAAVTAIGQQIVFWEGTDGLLHEMWWSSGAWNGPVLVDGGIAIASRPGVMVATQSQAQVLFWQRPDGGMGSLWYTAGQWNGPVPVAGITGMLSGPTAINAPGGVQAVFWQGGDGNLAEAWWTPANLAWNGPVTAGGGFPMGSAPAAALTVDNQQIVFWRGIAASVDEVWWNSSSGWNGPAMYGFASSRSGPGLVADTGGSQRVFWVGSDRNVWLSTWTAGTWSAAADLLLGPVH